jgi:hypothetical protein
MGPAVGQQTAGPVYVRRRASPHESSLIERIPYMRRMLPFAFGFVVGSVVTVRTFIGMCHYYGVLDDANAVIRTIKAKQDACRDIKHADKPLDIVRAAERAKSKWTHPSSRNVISGVETGYDC